MKKLDKAVMEDITALTPMQEGMLYHYLKDPKCDLYFEQLSLEISGKIDRHCFEQAWNLVIKVNEMLRTVFRWEKLEKPSQIILKEHQCQVSFYDLSGKDCIQKKTALEEIKKKDRRETFDLQEVPFRVILCKLEGKKFEVVISNHHILYDGWSTGIILKEFFKAYHELCSGKQSIKLLFKPPFKEFIKWIQNQDRIKQEKFWGEYLTGFETPTTLPIKRRIEETTKTEDYSIVMEEEIRSKLDVFVKNNRVTLASVFYSAWGILLQKYCDSEDVIFGTTVSGRSVGVKGIEDMVGLFINTIPLRVQSAPGTKVIDVIPGIENLLRKREEFENTPLVDIRSYSRVESSGSLFDTIVAIENYPLDNRLVPDGSLLSIHSYSIAEMTHYDLSVGIMLFNKIEVKFSYKRGFFDKAAVENLARHFKYILQSVVDNPAEEVSLLEIISSEEKSRILYEFNNTAAEYPGYKNIHLLIEEQVEKTPDKIALLSSFHHYITYKGLNESADYLGWVLKNKGVGPNVIIGLMVDRSIEMIVGILGILKSGGTYLPIDQDYPPERVLFMLENSQSPLLVTRPKFIGPLEFSGEVIDVESTGSPINKRDSGIIDDRHDLLYMIYTSGSTGKPKGVMIQKEGFLNLLRWYIEEFDIGEEDNCLLIAPISFDLSQKNLFSPFLAGGCLTLSSPGIPNYGELAELIHREHITMINCAPSVFCPLIEADADRGFARLHSLRAIILGGEPIRSDKLLPWVNSESFHCEIINTYGPTECTDIASFYRIPINAFHLPKAIPIGKPIPNVKVYVLDKYLKVLPVRIPGELCIGGIGLSNGYYDNIPLTRTKFVDTPHLPEKKVYRTGDLTRWLPDGNIEFLGRGDHQVKVRGFRIELGEIESELARHEEINEVVVTSRQSETGENYLCAYIVARAEQQISVSSLQEYLGRELPDYMVPAYFVFVDRIPLTPSGKIDHRGLPEPGIKKEKKYVAPRNRIEEELVKIWRGVLEIKALPTAIGIDDNFFHMGGHSLKATSLGSRIHKVFNVKIPLAEIFKRPTIRELSGYIGNTVEEQYTGIEPVEKKDFYLLSSAQKRMYFLHQMDKTGTAYNISAAWLLEGIIDKPKLEQSIAKLIRRHESLRTSFNVIDEEPVQRIHNQVEFKIENYDLAMDERIQTRTFLATEGTEGKNHHSSFISTPNHFIRAFDLLKAPLLRMGLLESTESNHLFMVDMHHIISDGMSIEILAGELSALLAGQELPAIGFRYKDYAAWQFGEKKSKNLREQENYWLKEFTDEIPVLDLPTDFVRPAIQSFAGDSINFELGREITDSIKALSLEAGATLYMVLLALYTIFLAKISNREDIVIGTPVAGRRHADLEKIIGMFVNTLALRNYPSGEKKFTDFLGEIKVRTLKAFENQDYQYEDLVEQVAVNRDASRNPLFDVMFVLQNMGVGEINIPGLKLVPYDLENKTSKFDLTLTGMEIEEKLEFIFEYCTKLFKPATIERFIIYFKNIVSGVLQDKCKRLSELEILSAEEKSRILYEFNNTAAEFPGDKTIHGLFAEQVENAPDRIAVVCGTPALCGCPVYLSYRELNEQSDRLAYMLNEKGVLPDDIVGVMMERSVQMIIGIIGILKSGGAYLPINPGYPEERIDYMLKDSGAKIMIGRAEERKSGRAEFVFSYFFLASSLSRFLASDSSNLAYIIYTSGSTGQPKGVPICHANLSPLLHWGYRELGITPHDRAVQNLSYFFDWSVWEIFITLTSGASLYMVSGEVVVDAERYLDFIYRHAITVLHITPTHFQSMLHVSPRQRLNTLRYLCIGAEKLNCDLVERSYTWIHEDCRVFNMYGPTEATIMAAVLEIHKSELSFYRELSSVPIGKTLGNNFLSILNRHLRPCPLFVPGELYIGGDGVALGYLNNPEMTAERFNRSYRSDRAYILYKTGDLARWLPNPVARGGYIIEFLGRIDHQVKIRGFRIEPGEIENRLLEHEAVKEALVMAREHKNGEKYLCAYIIPHPSYSHHLPDTLKEYLSGRLPDYMIPAYFVPIAKMPLNPNGKVDLNALPLLGPAVTPAKGYIAPGNDREMALVDIWARVLEIDSAGIGIDDDFFELGGHSLNVTALIGRIHKELNIEVPFTEIFVSPTVRELAAYIGQEEESRYGEIPPVGKREYYPLSSAQKRLFVLQQMESGSTAYNIHGILEVEGPIDKEKLEDVFRQLIARHESLRTSFDVMDEEPVQRIHNHVEFKIENYDLATKDAKGREEKNLSEVLGSPKTLFQKGFWLPEAPPGGGILKEFVRPFDLSCAPLLRVGLVEGTDQKSILMVDMHHIISDGASVNVLIKDFSALFSGEKLPAMEIQYKDFTEWQNRRQEGEKIKQQEVFWLNEFAGEIPVLNLPVDYMRPLVKSFEGGALGFEIPVEQTRELKELALETKTTLFMVLLAIYNIFLAKISGQEDIVVGTPAAGRGHPSTEGIIGMFVNTLPLRNFPIGKESIDEFLSELRGRTLKAFENQDYLYDDLVESVTSSRDSSRNPLFDVMFALQDLEISEISVQGLKLKPYEYEENTSKFDMSLLAVEKGERLFFTFEYSTKLFKKETLERFIAYFKQVVSSVLEDTQKKIAEIEITPGHEIRQLLEVFNHPAVDYPTKTVMDLFTGQVDKAPHCIAGFYEGNYLTYEELNNRADVLAKIIKEI